MRLNKLGLVAGSALAMTWSVLATAPAHAVVNDTAPASPNCLMLAAHGPAVAARGGHTGEDTRPMSAEEQRAVRNDMKARLQQQGLTLAQAAQTTAEVPVYVHVMRDAQGNGDVTDRQITQQIAELNQDFAGGESSAAANLGFTFRLAGVDRYDNNQWHQDKQSNSYRKLTRQGGANALNMWIVDFKYLGIATFPWDYAKQPGIDGIRVQYSSLPGGSATNFNLGKTATHEAGHWFGLYHTFQGGCADKPGDEVRRHPRAGEPDVRLPRGPGLLPLGRAGPHPQLHGLQPRLLLRPVHARARARGPARCGRPTEAEPRRDRVRDAGTRRKPVPPGADTPPGTTFARTCNADLCRNRHLALGGRAAA